MKKTVLLAFALTLTACDPPAAPAETAPADAGTPAAAEAPAAAPADAGAK